MVAGSTTCVTRVTVDTLTRLTVVDAWTSQTCSRGAPRAKREGGETGKGPGGRTDK